MEISQKKFHEHTSHLLEMIVLLPSFFKYYSVVHSRFLPEEKTQSTFCLMDFPEICTTKTDRFVKHHFMDLFHNIAPFFKSVTMLYFSYKTQQNVINYVSYISTKTPTDCFQGLLQVWVRSIYLIALTYKGTDVKAEGNISRRIKINYGG